jgi:hypothetical protein
MANVSSAVRQAGNIFYLLVLFYVEENRYQEKFSLSIPNVVVGLGGQSTLAGHFWDSEEIYERRGYPPKPGHFVSSITYHEGLMALPRPGQLIDV